VQPSGRPYRRGFVRSGGNTAIRPASSDNGKVGRLTFFLGTERLFGLFGLPPRLP
jgi:hypothetical protein